MLGADGAVLEPKRLVGPGDLSAEGGFRSEGGAGNLGGIDGGIGGQAVIAQHGGRRGGDERRRAVDDGEQVCVKMLAGDGAGLQGAFAGLGCRGNCDGLAQFGFEVLGADDAVLNQQPVVGPGDLSAEGGFHGEGGAGNLGGIDGGIGGQAVIAQHGGRRGGDERRRAVDDGEQVCVKMLAGDGAGLQGAFAGLGCRGNCDGLAQFGFEVLGADDAVLNQQPVVGPGDLSAEGGFHGEGGARTHGGIDGGNRFVQGGREFGIEMADGNRSLRDVRFREIRQPRPVADESTGEQAASQVHVALFADG